MTKFRTKISLFGYIEVTLFYNPIFLILKSAPSTLSNYKTLPKYKGVYIWVQKRFLNMGKNLGSQIPYLGSFGLQRRRKLLYLK